jgi:hypothetical protein
MSGQRYALYVVGKESPVGTLSESTLGAMPELSEVTEKIQG